MDNSTGVKHADPRHGPIAIVARDVLMLAFVAPGPSRDDVG